MKQTIAVIFSLIKIRITTTVALITIIGWYIGNRSFGNPNLFFWVILSTILVCAGTCTLNHVLEWKSDAKMARTKNRPIPSNKISFLNAIGLGVILIAMGLFLMISYISMGMLVGSLITSLIYLLIYTPLKKLHWINTSVGAISGGLPIMGGWYAARGEIGLEGWLLLAILFFWQHPHFYAIAWVYRKDYQEGGYKMLVENDKSGKTTFLHSLIHTFFLILVSFSIIFTNFSAGLIYSLGMVIINIWFFYKIWLTYQNSSLKNARKVITASIIYLTILFMLVFLDNQFKVEVF